MSKTQKELLLKLLEHDEYREFGKQHTPRTPISKSRAEIDRFWTKAAGVLNAKGPATMTAEWKRTWHDCCRYAIKQAKLHGRPDEDDCSSDEFGTVKYTTGFPSVDRTMSIIGWDVAFSGGPSDEDKENPWEEIDMLGSNDCSLTTSGNNRARSPLSVLSTSRIISHQPPLKKRSLSPLSRSSSPASLRPMSPFTAVSTQQSSCAACAAGSTAGADIKALALAIDNIAEAIQKNTTVLQELKVLFTNQNTINIPQSQAPVGNANVEEIPIVIAEELVEQPAGTDYNLNMLAAPSGSDFVFSGTADIEDLEFTSQRISWNLQQ